MEAIDACGQAEDGFHYQLVAVEVVFVVAFGNGIGLFVLDGLSALVPTTQGDGLDKTADIAEGNGGGDVGELNLAEVEREAVPQREVACVEGMVAYQACEDLAFVERLDDLEVIQHFCPEENHCRLKILLGVVEADRVACRVQHRADGAVVFAYLA